MKKIFFLSIGFACALVMSTYAVQTNLLASLFPQTEIATNQGAPVFIPDNFHAFAGDVGEVDVRAGSSFPIDAQENFKGMSFTLDWNTNQADLLLASLTNTALATDPNMQLSSNINVENGTAEIAVVTSSDNIVVRPGDRLVELSFAIANTLTANDTITLPIGNVEVAYECDSSGSGDPLVDLFLGSSDCTGLQSEVVTNVGNGMITIDSPLNTITPDLANELFSLASDLSVRPGREVTAYVRTPHPGNIAGFVFDLSYPTAHATFLGAETAGTLLSDRSDFTIATDATPGHVRMIGATGQLGGLDVGSNDRLLALTFDIADDAPLNTIIPLTFQTIERVDKDLQYIQGSGTHGAITVAAADELQLLNVVPLSSTSVALEFNEVVHNASLTAVTMQPDLIKSDTILSLEGERVVLRNLTTMTPGNQYLLELTNTGTAFSSDTLGVVSATHRSAAWRGYPSDPVGDLELLSATATAADTVELIFSKPLNATALDKDNFDLFTFASGVQTPLFISSVTQDDTKIILRTATQTPDTQYIVTMEPSVTADDDSTVGPRAAATFSGFMVGRIFVSDVTPNTFDLGTSGNVTVSGAHLSADDNLQIGDVVLTGLTSTDDTSLSFALPAALGTGAYDLRITSATTGLTAQLPAAITVIDPATLVDTPIVLSDESFASPAKVPNDGITTTTLWVRVDDPRGVSDLDKVTIDLRAINGIASQELEFDSIVDNKAWYRTDVTVPVTVPTQTEPVDLPITAQNKAGKKGFGTVSLTISNDLTSSLPPEIIVAQASPDIATPNSTSVTLHVEVKDADGGDTVRQVVVDATSIGLGNIALSTLEPIGNKRQCTFADYEVGEYGGCAGGTQTRAVNLRDGIDCVDGIGKPAAERSCAFRACTVNDWEPDEFSVCTNGKQFRDFKLKPNVQCAGEDFRPIREERSCVTVSWLHSLFPSAQAADPLSGVVGQRIWFVSESFSIPTTTPDGSYALPIVAIDATGEEALGTVSITVSRDGNAPVLDDDDVYLSPNREGVFNDGVSEFQVFAKVTDPDGHATLSEVIANLTPLSLGVVPLKKGAIEGNGAWYFSDPLIVSKKVPRGRTEITIAATDVTGASSEVEYDITVAEPGQFSDPGEILVDRSYTTPSAFKNDGVTQGTVYIFVEKGDADLDYTALQLGDVAQFNPPGGATSWKPVADRCASTTSSVCLQPGIQEGQVGQWFHAPHITVPFTTLPSADPYFVTATSVDIDGNATSTQIPLIVSNDAQTLDKPSVVTAVATSPTTTRVLFSSPLDPNKIDNSVCRIATFADVNNPLVAKSSTISADGKILTIRTTGMPKATLMAVTCDAEKLNLSTSQAGNNQTRFDSYDEDIADNSFRIDSVTATSSNAIAITFSKPVDFTSIVSSGDNATITEKSSDTLLDVTAARVSEDAKTIIVSTSAQQPGATYIVKLDGIYDFVNKPLRNGGHIRTFTGYSQLHSSGIGGNASYHKADFNRSGNIDFLDFSIFSSAYGTANVTFENGTKADFNEDGQVDFLDFSIFSQYYGLTVAPAFSTS